MTFPTDNTLRRGFLTSTGALVTGGVTVLAGCGDSSDQYGDDEPDRTPENGEDSTDTDESPQLEDVNLYLDAENGTADFTQEDQYALGLKAELSYSDGSTETREIADYEVESAEIRKTSEDGVTKANQGYDQEREGYGVFNGIGGNLDFIEFSDEDLKKAGHYQELEDIQIQDGKIVLDSNDLITGYSEVNLAIDITDEQIQEYSQQGLIDTNQQYQNIIEVNKPEEQVVEDLKVQGPEAVELWQKFREMRAETILGKMPLTSSNEYDTWLDLKRDVAREVEQEVEENELTLQEELAQWGTIFGRKFMESSNGAAPSGGTTELADILADAELITSDLDIIPGVIADQGHNSNPVYIPGSDDPSNEEFWNGNTVNVNTGREEAADTPAELTHYEFGDFGSIFKEKIGYLSKSIGTFASFMRLNQEDVRINGSYCLELVPEFADDTEVWQDNLQHLVETAVGDLFATEHELEPTGSPENPEVELR